VNESALRDQIVATGAALYDRGYTHGSTGNISARCEAGWLLTPTNACLGRLDPARLSLLTPDTSRPSGDPPSKESFLHLAIYQERSALGAVVHLHGTHSTAVSVLADVDPDDVLPPLTAYYVMRVGRLPLVPYHKPGDATLAEAVRAAAKTSHAVLLANHGPVVAGTTLAGASDAVEELEQTARLYLMLHGRAIRPLDERQVADLRASFPPPG
jgi:3-dehydro-4-phosphotetronate decarboxylase